MIYLAYGSNLNKHQMARRCPDAVPMGFIMLPNYRLVFKGVADMIPDPDTSCPVGLWRITDRCEAALDRYEGFPNLYRKEYFSNDDGHDFMAYVMNRDGLGLPPTQYYQGILEGYKDFGIDQSHLVEALRFTKEYDTGDGHIPKRYK
tara:strand:- start:274 stop:714 length:441 start_codon:yes stop_codon:yes gene_type:complete